MKPSSIKFRCPLIALRRIGNPLFVAFLLAVANPTNAQTIHDSIYVYPAGSLQYQNLSLTSISFQHAENNRINIGLTGDKFYYVLLKIVSPAAMHNRFLLIDNTTVDSLVIYRVIPEHAALKLYQGGQLIPFQRGRDFLWHAVQVEVSDHPSYYLLAVKSSHKNINLGYHILARAEIVSRYLSYERVVFFYLGIAFMIATIILLALAIFRRTIFTVYFLYIICISGWIMAHYGVIFLSLYPQTPVWNRIIEPVSSLGAGLLLLTTLKMLFATTIQSSLWLMRAIRILQVLVLTTILSLLFLLHPQLDDSMQGLLFTTWYVELFALIGFIAFIALRNFKSAPPNRIVALAMIIICTTVLIQFSANLGLITNRFVAKHGMAVGSLLENSLMAFALLYGLIRERKAKELQMRMLETDQRETVKKLISLEDKERRRIASDLHDNIGPLLAALKINFLRIKNAGDGKQQSELIHKTINIIDDSISEIRNMAHNLMPKGLSSNGLTNTLKSYFEDLEQLFEKRIAFANHTTAILPAELQTTIYRIVSEMAMNAARHSEASEITIWLRNDALTVSIEIQDNGRGFDYKQTTSGNAFGIQSAESRVRYLKGQFSVDTAPGRGTTVRILLPL